MRFSEGEIYHIYNRGNNGQTIFFSDKNYLYFLGKMKKFIYPNCDVLAWCLMPNHFHFLIYANERSGVHQRAKVSDTSKVSDTFAGKKESNELKKSDTATLAYSGLVEGIRHLLSSYTKGINVQHGRTGNLFQQKTKSKCVTEMQAQESSQASDTSKVSDAFSVNYAEVAFHYIHQNPLNAGLVNRLEDWEYSSFKDYAGLRNGTLCNKELATRLLDLNMKNFINDSYSVIRDDEIEMILGGGQG